MGAAVRPVAALTCPDELEINGWANSEIRPVTQGQI